MLPREGAETKMDLRGAPPRLTWQGVAQAFALAAPPIPAALLGGGSGSPADRDQGRARGALWLLLRLSFAVLIPTLFFTFNAA